MEENRFTEIDRWLTRTLRHGLRGLFASVDELHRQATDQQFGKQELLWVAHEARKRIRHGPSICRNWIGPKQEHSLVLRMRARKFIGRRDAEKKNQLIRHAVICFPCREKATEPAHASTQALESRRTDTRRSEAQAGTVTNDPERMMPVSLWMISILTDT